MENSDADFYRFHFTLVSMVMSPALKSLGQHIVDSHSLLLLGG
jgi:hypothetical protein